MENFKIRALAKDTLVEGDIEKWNGLLGRFLKESELSEKNIKRDNEALKTHGNRIVLLAELKGRPVGFVDVEMLAKPPRCMRIRKIYVLPEYRRKGLAAKLERKAHYLGRMAGREHTLVAPIGLGGNLENWRQKQEGAWKSIPQNRFPPLKTFLESIAKKKAIK